MFVKHGREPSWVLQFNKQEIIMMLAMMEKEDKDIKKLEKERKKGIK